MTQLFLLTRSVGDTFTPLGIFKLKTSAETCRDLCTQWFKRRGPIRFSRVWDHTRARFYDQALRAQACPYDPGHVDDFPLLVPTYEVHEVDLLSVGLFRNRLLREAKAADRAMFGKGATK